MATWSGWQNEFLQSGGIIETPPNRNFLTEWARHASSPQCRNNPVDLSVKVAGSTNCVKPAGPFPWTQAYTSHAAAATAFNREIHTSYASAILTALNSGNPFQVKSWQDVVGQLRQWPSVNFADWYLGQMQGGAGGSGSGGIAPQTHQAWTDLQRAVDKRLPAALRRADRANLAALRAVGRARKVRH